MDHLHKLKNEVRNYIFLLGMITVLLMVGIGWLLTELFPQYNTLISGVLVMLGVFAVWLLAVVLSNYALKPLETVWRAILHVTPGHVGTAPPNLDQNKVGKELVRTLSLQVYQLASQGSQFDPNALNKSKPVADTTMSDITRDLPIPVLAINKEQVITYANDATCKYLGLAQEEIVRKNLYSVMDMAFSDERTLDLWLQECRTSKATAQHFWQRVRLKLGDQKTVKQFDLAGAYSKENPNGIELVLTLFDQTSRYQTDDQSLDFIALAVHELRTPLTALRGYIEVFNDEVGPQLDPELKGYMQRMETSAQQLTAFISNVLNVARIQEGQLSLQLTEENWAAVVQSAVAGVAQAAQLKGMTIQYTVDPKIPTVAVDKISITEVINNLIDNAIKYSGTSKIIRVDASLTTDGLIETVVRDDGVGIPASVMPTLFEKFHRNHRNQARIGGTGLGLYLCSSLIKAHGGNIWLKSKEGEGTSVGFTILPYSQVADSLKGSNNNDITRNAHGWIKNHSLYRR